ncbi:hypothetical protein FT663_03705 [Candidozyma haemuli var. vulneris]|nr:hypothetical protein FT662_03841 [[Candida] haemuloni var. vulneris]KAF3989245.1 hypothetical protein FT663_03705 [[Candida] haemuloni var. vulneris]
MKWTQFFLVVAAWCSVALAAYSDSEMQALVSSKGRNSVIELRDDNFEKFLYGDRDYDLVLYMASDSPQLNCILCREIHPSYRTVATSWTHAHPHGFTEEEKLDQGRTNIYFLEADFMSAKKLFQLMQLDSIPKIYHFPPSKPGAKVTSFLTEHSQYQFYQGEHTSLIAQWVREIVGVPIEIHVPMDWGKVALNAVITFLVVLLLKRFSSYASAVFRSSYVWGTVSSGAMLMFISGYMFNQIRGAPFVRETDNGVEYFAPSPQSQYGLESQLISSLYGFLGLTFVLLASKVPKINNAKVQLLAVVTISALIYLAYSAYLSFFGFKSRGYPYRLLDFGI